MTGFLRSIGFIADEPSHVPAVAAVESASVEAHEPTPSPADSVSGRDAEPEHLRRKRERVQRAEVERDLALADYTLALARFSDQRPTWAVD